MNRFLLGAVRLPLFLVMLAFLACIVSMLLLLADAGVHLQADLVTSCVLGSTTLLLLIVLLAYCQLRYQLDQYLEAEQQATQDLCQRSQVSNPLHFITGSMHGTSEQRLQARIAKLRQGYRQPAIGEDTSYEGEEDFDNLGRELADYHRQLDAAGNH